MYFKKEKVILSLASYISQFVFNRNKRVILKPKPGSASCSFASKYYNVRQGF